MNQAFAACPNCGGNCPSIPTLVFPVCRYPAQYCRICFNRWHATRYHNYFVTTIGQAANMANLNIFSGGSQNMHQQTPGDQPSSMAVSTSSIPTIGQQQQSQSVVAPAQDQPAQPFQPSSSAPTIGKQKSSIPAARPNPLSATSSIPTMGQTQSKSVKQALEGNKQSNSPSKTANLDLSPRNPMTWASRATAAAATVAPQPKAVPSDFTLPAQAANTPPISSHLNTSSSESNLPANAANTQDVEMMESLQQADAFLAQLKDEAEQTRPLAQLDGEAKNKAPRSATTSMGAPRQMATTSSAAPSTGGDTVASDADNKNHLNTDIPCIYHAGDALRAIHENRRIFVGNLPKNTTEEDLKYTFGGCEEGSAILVPSTILPCTGGRGAFVSYPNEKEARSAVAHFSKRAHCRLVSNHDVQVSNAKASASCREGRRIFIENVSERATEMDLAEFLHDCTLEMISLPRDPITDRRLGNSLISFPTKAAADIAIKDLDGTMLLGKTISVRSSQPTAPEPGHHGFQIPHRLAAPEESNSIAQPAACKFPTLGDREAELKLKVQLSRDLNRGANQSTSSAAFRSSRAVTAATQPMNIQPSGPKCEICSGIHLAFAPECRFKQDYYEVARKIEERLGINYTGPSCFQNWAELLRYDVNDRPFGPVIRWPDPKKRASQMSDEQFSLILLDALSYKHPNPAFDRSQHMESATNKDETEINLVPFSSRAAEAPGFKFQAPSHPHGALYAINLKCSNCPGERIFSDIIALRQHHVVAHASPEQLTWVRQIDGVHFECAFCRLPFDADKIGIAMTRVSIAQHVALTHPNEVKLQINRAQQLTAMQQGRGWQSGPAQPSSKRRHDDHGEAAGHKRIKREKDNGMTWGGSMMPEQGDRAPGRGGRGIYDRRLSRSPHVHVRLPSGRQRSRSPVHVRTPPRRHRSRSPLHTSSSNAYETRRRRSRSPARLSSDNNDEAERQKWRRERDIVGRLLNSSSSNFGESAIPASFRGEERRHEARRAGTSRRVDDRNRASVRGTATPDESAENIRNSIHQFREEFVKPHRPTRRDEEFSRRSGATRRSDDRNREAPRKPDTSRRVEGRGNSGRGSAGGTDARRRLAGLEPKLLEPGASRSRAPLHGRFFEDKIGGSYYNGTGTSTMELTAFRPALDHYSPPVGPFAIRVKQEEMESASIRAMFGGHPPPKGPKSMGGLRDGGSYGGSGGNFAGLDVAGMGSGMQLVSARGGESSDGGRRRDAMAKSDKNQKNFSKDQGRLSRDWTEEEDGGREEGEIKN